MTDTVPTNNYSPIRSRRRGATRTKDPDDDVPSLRERGPRPPGAFCVACIRVHQQTPGPGAAQRLGGQPATWCPGAGLRIRQRLRLLPSPSFRGWRSLAGCFAWWGMVFEAAGAYDLTAWTVAVEVEDVDEFVLVGGGLGEHSAGFGSASFGGVDQDRFFDAGELVE